MIASQNNPPLQHDTALQVFEALRARATLYAFVGVLIALIAVVLATLLLCIYVYDGISVISAYQAHSENIALWALDAMPFVFAWWGQYSSTKMAADASTIVDSRTDELRQELDQARYTARAKTDFFARMSHELRTPINAIVGMSELVMAADDPDQRRQHAQVIHDSAYGLLSLVNDVLDFSRIEAGRMELDDVGFDLHDHLNGTALLLDQQARAKNLQLVSLVPPDAPRRVVGDPGRLRQIVVNLVGNAIKFTQQGEIVLSLREWQQLESGDYRLRIDVADTGAGIDPAQQSMLFEPYHRAGESRTEGTGLGLSITRELIHAMDGDITVESQPGAGSVFSFTVQLGAARAPQRRESGPTLRGRRVLLVDPGDPRADALAEQLRTLGMWITRAEDGVEAMQTALRAASEGAPYDLLLTDLFLPHLSGEELGRRLKLRPQTRSMCLAVMTATGARGDAKRLNEAGFAGYLTRPIPPEGLEGLLQAILATRDLPEGERRRQGLVTRFHASTAGTPARPVLVVDDSAINRQITCNHLRQLGIDLETADDGAGALEALERTTFGAILMDLRLPDMDGSEIIRQLRSGQHAARKVPIVVLTAGTTDDERRQCEALGIEAFLTRPVDRAELQRVLAAHVGHPGKDRSGPPQTPGDETPADGSRTDPRAATESGSTEAATANENSNEAEIAPALVEIFLQETEQRVSALQSALQDSPDFALAARHAHTIGSASQHFHGLALSRSARRLEHCAESRDVGGARLALQELAAEWAVLQRTLQADPTTRSEATAEVS